MPFGKYTRIPSKNCSCLLMIHQGAVLMSDFASHQITSVSCLVTLLKIFLCNSKIKMLYDLNKLFKNFCNQYKVLQLHVEHWLTSTTNARCVALSSNASSYRVEHIRTKIKTLSSLFKDKRYRRFHIRRNATQRAAEAEIT